jgi:hypothetical protein
MRWRIGEPNCVELTFSRHRLPVWGLSVIATGAIAYSEWEERIAGAGRQLEATLRTDAYPEVRVFCPTALTSFGALYARNVCLRDVPKSCYIFGLAEGRTANSFWRCD